MPSQPFSVSLGLKYPPDYGLPQVTRATSVVGTFTQISEQLLSLVGSGSHSVSFGSIVSPGAKALMVEVDNDADAQPVQVTFNGADTPVEIAPGGCMLLCNPTPVSGLTSLAIAHTTAVSVHVRLLA